MNDEPAPPTPALRLKPRLRPAEGQAPDAIPSSGESPAFPPPPPIAPGEVTPQDPPAPEVASTPKIRFKPRLEPTPRQVAEVPAPSSAAPVALPPLDAGQGALPVDAMANPRVTAPAPPLFATPSAPVTPPPLFISDPAPTAEAAPAAPAPSDGGKFKLKPKLSPLVPPSPSAAAGAPPSAVVPPAPAPVPPVSAPPPVARPPGAVKAPPPFPVMAPAGAVKAPPPPFAPRPPTPTGGTAAPMPTADSTPPMVPARKKSSVSGLLKVAAVVVLAGAGFFGWQHFKSTSAPVSPPPSAPPTKAPATVSAPLTPSETLNSLAHAPANAINKAQDAIATRRASGQSRIDAASIGEDLPDASPGASPTPATSPAKPAATTAVASTTIAPGLAATTHVEAAPEASAAFRAFVANAKVSGVYQGPPSRAVINGRLTRTGEPVDSSLGIVFEGVDSSRRHLLFKDRAGATVSRRF